VERWLWRLLTAGLVLLIVIYGGILFAMAANAEETPHVVYTHYNGTELFGIAEAPDGWWARVTMYIDDDSYFVLFAPILPNGTFQAWIFSMCRYITVAVTDYPIIHAQAQGAVETWPSIAWE